MGRKTVVTLGPVYYSPILMAVSCLSPVRIQILMSAFIRVSIVSGTRSCSLSSIAVAPSSCRFYSKDQRNYRYQY